MNTVEPIRDKAKIEAIKANLKGQDHPRDFLLFVMGINSALRYSDLIRLKVNDVMDEEGNVIHHIYLRQEKTKKEIKPLINEAVRKALEFYFGKVKGLGEEDYLFTSYRGNKPLSNTDLWSLVNKWCEDVGLEGGDRYGSHTLRKTWGYQAWKAGVPLEVIAFKLGHKDNNTALRYIGALQEECWAWEARVNL